MRDAHFTVDRRNDLLSIAVLALAADGYSALVSYGEISPDFGNRGLLLSTTEDGAALARPAWWFLATGAAGGTSPTWSSSK